MSEPRAVLEPIVPEPGTFTAQTMPRGEPGVPAQFSWRGNTYVVVEVLDSRRELGRFHAETSGREWWPTSFVNTCRVSAFDRTEVARPGHGGATIVLSE